MKNLILNVKLGSLDTILLGLFALIVFSMGFFMMSFNEDLGKAKVYAEILISLRPVLIMVTLISVTSFFQVKKRIKKLQNTYLENKNNEVTND